MLDRFARHGLDRRFPELAALVMIGTAQVVNLWAGESGAAGGLVALPILAVLAAVPVHWLYRAETWPNGRALAQRTQE